MRYSQNWAGVSRRSLCLSLFDFFFFSGASPPGGGPEFPEGSPLMMPGHVFMQGGWGWKAKRSG